MKGIKPNFLMEPPGHKIGLDLPQVCIKLKASLELPQDAHPARQVEIIEGKGGTRSYSQGLYNALPVRWVRQDVNLVKPGELGNQIPTKYRLPMAQLGITGGAAHKGTSQYAQLCPALGRHDLRAVFLGHYHQHSTLITLS